MGEHCCSLHANAVDPTRTTALRRRFEQEFNRRFRKLRGKIRQAVLEEDGFGLKVNRGQFDRPRSAEKVAAFTDWLRATQREVLFGLPEGLPSSEAGRQLWAAPYLGQAYEGGVRRAAAQMRAAGAEVSEEWVAAAIRREQHLDRVGLVFTRVYEELEGVTEAMGQEISRVLADGIVQARGPTQITKDINDRVNKIGRNRAAMIARTEVVSAHAEATLTSFEEAGLSEVQIEAEFSTSGDSRVCEECASLEGRTYTIEESRGVIPVHPNCRCAFIPVIRNGRGVELR